MNKIKKFFSTISTFFKKIVEKTGIFINDAYDKASELAKKVVPPAVQVTQFLKTFFESNKDDVIVDVITDINPIAGKYSKKVQVFLEKYLPEIAVKLQIIESVVELEGVQATTEYIMKKFAITDNRGEKALAFAAELALYLSDGKITLTEAKAAANSYYNKFIKK